MLFCVNIKKTLCYAECLASYLSPSSFEYLYGLRGGLNVDRARTAQRSAMMQAQWYDQQAAHKDARQLRTRAKTRLAYQKGLKQLGQRQASKIFTCASAHSLSLSPPHAPSWAQDPQGQPVLPHVQGDARVHDLVASA